MTPVSHPTPEAAPQPRKRRPAPKYRRACPECAKAFLGPRDAKFCTPECKTSFHNRMKARGQAAIPLLLAWRGGKSRRGDPSAAYAFAQLCALADIWNAQDRTAGRIAPGDYIKGKMDAGWRAVDLGN